LVVATQAALAAVEELPSRQRVMDSVAVLKYLYKSRLQYVDKLKMYEYNVNITETQFQTIHGLYLAELRQPRPDVMKLQRYEKTLINLIDQFHQFSGTRYVEGLKTLRVALQGAKARLESLPAATETPSATPTVPAAPKEAAALPEAAPAAAPAAPVAPAAPAATEALPAAGGLESAAAELEKAAPETPATAETRPAAPAEAAPAAPAAKAPAASALNEVQRAIADLGKSIEGLKSKIDGYNAANYIDYAKLFNQRIAELDGQLAHYESVLNARVAEYHALFGMAPPVDLGYKAELERMHPSTNPPGLFVLE